MYEKQSRNTNRSSDTIASFLLKTYEILEHPEYERMISWDKNNVGFIIHDVVSFTRQILPKYFRHSNFSSFVRQLNMYDFHKVKQQNDSLVFKNPLFCKGEQQNLKFIRRKAAKKLGGQRRQQASEKNDVQNQKYQNLLKGFKKSIESEINQSALFYERSIQLLKDLNESNQKKQSYIGNLFAVDQKTDTTEEIKNQEIQENEPNGPQSSSKPRKDTIIQIPKEFLDLEADENKKVQKKEENEKKKVLNLDNVVLLKEEIYKSLGVYQSWLQDFIETQRKKIKYVNGYRQQLVKCRQSKNSQNTENKDPQNEDQNQKDGQDQQNNVQKLKSNGQSLTNKLAKEPSQSNLPKQSSLFGKKNSNNGNEQNESQSLINKLQNKNQVKSNNVSAIRPFQQPQTIEKLSKQNAGNYVSPIKMLAINSQFSSRLFSNFAKSKEEKQSQQKPSQSQQSSESYQNQYINESEDQDLVNNYENQDENGI